MADTYDDLFNADVFDQHGNRIGPVGQVYLDDQTGSATWATVKTGLFGLKETFVPLAKAVVDGQKLTVPYDAQLVKDAPRVDPDKHLDAAEEAELYAHYGITNVMAAQVDVAAPVEDAEAPVVEETVVEESVEEVVPVADGEAEQPVVETVTEETAVETTEVAAPAAPAADSDIDLYGEVKN